MTNENKVGVLINHLRSRQDTHELLLKMSKIQSVILLIEIEDKFVAESLELDYHIIKPIRKREKIIQNILFYFQKHTVLHREETLNARLKKIKSDKYSEFVFKKLIFSFGLSFKRLLPAAFIYKFLSHQELPLISRALVFSVVDRHDILGELLGRKIAVDLYVYSWDHPVKEISFNYPYRKILVWSEHIAEDIRLLHNPICANYVPIGSTQLFYLSKDIRKTCQIEYQYIYFVFSLGRKEMVLQELELLREIVNTSSKTRLGCKIIVRLYPNTSEELLVYLRNELDSMNVIVDDNILTSLDANSKKRVLLQDARLVIHSGTTVGIEADVLNSCVVLFTYRGVNYASTLRVTPNLDLSKNAFLQWHIQKYFVLSPGRLTADTVDDLVEILNTCQRRVEINREPYGIKLATPDEFLDSLNCATAFY